LKCRERNDPKPFAAADPRSAFRVENAAIGISAVLLIVSLMTMVIYA
jgi:hypothetical protein